MRGPLIMKLIMKLIMTLIMTSNLTRLAHRSFTLHERSHERPHERSHERSHERPHVRIALIAFLHEVAKEPKRSIVGDLLLESAESLNLNLANALAGDPEVSADLIESPLDAIKETETQNQDLLLAFGQRAEGAVDLLSQFRELRLARGLLRFRLLLEATEDLIYVNAFPAQRLHGSLLMHEVFDLHDDLNG